jgi:hypothetical protein
MSSLAWKEELVKLVYIKQAIADLDKGHLYPHHLPNVAATSVELDKSQNALGFKLEQDHAAFLLCANGWDGFLQNTDLFGTGDFSGSDRYQAAQQTLDIYDVGVFEGIGIPRTHLFPIGASSVDGNIYAMVKRTIQSSKRIFWLEGDEREHFPSFSDFFVAMLDYNRFVLQVEQEARTAPLKS